MTNVELKEQLISKIYITEDKDILEFVLEFLKQSSGISEPYIFNEEQKRRIDIALQQSQKGDVYSEEEGKKI